MKLVALLLGLCTSASVFAQSTAVPGRVPEPETLGLIVAAAAAGAYVAWKRKHKK
jgi:hypothetical protein